MSEPAVSIAASCFFAVSNSWYLCRQSVARQYAFQRPEHGRGLAMGSTTRRGGGCCSVSFVKWFLVIYTLISIISGCLVVGVAVWTLLDRHKYVVLLTFITYPTIIYLLLGAGVLLIIDSILGLVAAAKENRISLIIYIIILILIFVTEATVGILSYIYREQLHSILEMNLNDNFMNLYGVDTTITEAVDTLQGDFKCCGVTNFENWNASTWFQDGITNTNLVPDSCCISKATECGRRTHPSNIYYDGCMDTMEAHMKDKLYFLCAVGLGICLPQLFGVISAFILYCKLRRVLEISKPSKKNTETQALFP